MKNLNDTLPVSEQFYSIQGEGRTVGIPSYFLRLKSCNILCGGKGTDKDGELHDDATWRCDTIEVWLKGLQKTFDEIIKDFGPYFLPNLRKGVHIVITGGEPLLHQDKVLEFIDYLNQRAKRHVFVEIETNGTILMRENLMSKVAFVNLSPKLSNSGVPYDKRIKMDTLREFADLPQAIFKFVVSGHKDFDELTAIVDNAKIKHSKIYLMSAGSDRKTLEMVDEHVIARCLEYGYKFSPRLHVLVWDKKTGV